MAVQLRIAQEQDYDTVIAMRLRTMRAVSGMKDTEDFTPQFMQETLRYFKEGRHTTVLAFDGDEAIGCASICYYSVMPTVSHPGGCRAHIMNVFVDQAYRRRGIAKEMLHMLLDDAQSMHATEISLDATEMGRPLYASLGFRPSGEYMVLCPVY